MSFSARICFSLAVSGLLVVAGCSASHVTTGDAGPVGDASCTGGSLLICVQFCASDAGAPPICVSGSWRCPPGTVDLSTCPPGCIGRPPSPDCVCEGTRWSCPDGRCPDGIDPWATPGTACGVEGAHCSGGGTDPCGSALECDCSGGHWSCLVAEPDPVCYCGREPSAGDRCNEEGAACGECCPTLGGTGWAAMTCVDGHWQPAACPELVCPPIAEDCPVDRASALGTACLVEHQLCGNPCCDSAFQCSGGVWVEGPFAACACDPSTAYACGAGTCERGQACSSHCGPADGIEHSCSPLPEGCTSCECVTVPAGYTCEVRDGHVFLSMSGFCG